RQILQPKTMHKIPDICKIKFRKYVLKIDVVYLFCNYYHLKLSLLEGVKISQKIVLYTEMYRIERGVDDFGK
ncbi:MAG: hypothetical protein FWD01_05325, partial [Defluviitaleaceae bacterium]|nr:hypothetical protein [Defluviitaleaceae bacterium]